MNLFMLTRWILRSFISIRRSQRNSLAAISIGALKARRAGLYEIGRAMQPQAMLKHRVKRVWRFLKNDRIDLAAAQRDLVVAVFRPLRTRTAHVAVDWVDIKNYKVLVAAVVVQGRAVPILWAAYEKWQLHKSQNNLEGGFFRLLKSLLPGWAKVVIVADRGFGRTSLAATLVTFSSSFMRLVRVWSRPAVSIKTSSTPRAFAAAIAS